MSKSLKSLIVVTALLALMPLAASPADAPQKSYVVLDKNLSRLRADFNANIGKVRMLYIVGPTCGTRYVGCERYSLEIHTARPDRIALLVKTAGSSKFESRKSSKGIVIRGKPHGLA